MSEGPLALHQADERRLAAIPAAEANGGFVAVSGPSQGDPCRRGIRPIETTTGHDPQCPVDVDCVEKPQNARAPNSRICAATAGINADDGLKAHRKATQVEVVS
jgi:hypothetical protein